MHLRGDGQPCRLKPPGFVRQSLRPVQLQHRKVPGPVRAAVGEGVVPRPQHPVLPGAQPKGVFQGPLRKDRPAQGGGSQLMVHHMVQGLLRCALKPRGKKADAPGHVLTDIVVLLVG